MEGISVYPTLCHMEMSPLRSLAKIEGIDDREVGRSALVALGEEDLPAGDREGIALEADLDVVISGLKAPASFGSA